MEKTVREYLEELSEPAYQEFSSRLLPEVNDILGVRLPKLRSLAKQIAKENGREYLRTASDDSFEERMLQGMVIGNMKEEVSEILKLSEEFIPKLDNWSVCDSFCSSLKIAEKYQEEVWDFLKPYFRSDQEFEVRFGVVMLLNYFILDAYLEQVFIILNQIKQEGYYAKMAVSWAISICYVKFPKQTMAFLKDNRLDSFTYHKALQKITESYRVSEEEKKEIRAMKRKSAPSPRK